MRNFCSILVIALILSIPIPANAGDATPEMARDVASTHIDAVGDFDEHSIFVITPVIDSENGEKLGYIAHLSPRGYIAISADTDIRPVIAYSAENDLDMTDILENVPLRIFKRDMRVRLAARPFMSPNLIHRNNSLWRNYLGRSESFMAGIMDAFSLGPYLDTEWNQGDPYNIFCPIDPMTGGRCPIGCVVTAMAQIINYWEWPHSVAFDTSESYESDITMPPIFIDAPTASVDTIDYNADGLNPDDTTLAKLMFACGVSIFMQYSDEGSSAMSADVLAALLAKWDYATANGIFPTMPDFYTTMTLDVLEGRVSYLSLTDEEVGHAIVIDGYRESGENHVNYGWGGSADGWYFLPDSLPYGFTIANYAIVGILPPVITHRPVTGLRAEQLNGGYVHLIWNEPSLITEDVLHYNVYRRRVAEITNELMVTTGSMSFIDDDFDELTNYTYSVGAVYDCGESALEEIDQYSGIYNGWTRIIYRFGHERPYSIAPLGDGGFVAAGSRCETSGENREVYIIAMSFDGDMLWDKTYGGGEHDHATSIAKTSDSGYIVSGATESFGSGGSDIWLLRLDSEGDTLWTRTYGGAFDDISECITVCGDGGFLILGQTNDGVEDLMSLIKTNSSGTVEWEKTFGGGLVGKSIIDLSGVGYAVGGYANPGPIGSSDCFIMKTDDSGDSLWLRFYGGSSLDEAYSIAEAGDGGLVIAGKSRSFGMPLYTTTFCIKTDVDGDTLWSRTYGGMKNYGLNYISATEDGGFLAVGFVENESNDLYLQYLDSGGDTLATHIYSTISGEEGVAIIQLPDSGIAIAGRTYLSGSDDFWLMKVGGRINAPVREEERILLPETSDIQAYPNPFNSAVTISVGEGLRPSRVEIFDINGKRVRGFEGSRVRGGTPNAEHRAPINEFVWRPDESIGSGVYLIRAVGDEGYYLKRVVYLK